MKLLSISARVSRTESKLVRAFLPHSVLYSFNFIDLGQCSHFGAKYFGSFRRSRIWPHPDHKIHSPKQTGKRWIGGESPMSSINWLKICLSDCRVQHPEIQNCVPSHPRRDERWANSPSCTHDMHTLFHHSFAVSYFVWWLVRSIYSILHHQSPFSLPSIHQTKV